MNEKELKTLAAQVLSEYNIIPKEVSIIQGGSIKTVWKFESNKGVFCLKRLKQTLDKALFSVNAQIYIKDAGGNVPGIYLDKHGEPIVMVKDQLFVVYEWLNGRDLNFNNDSDLSLALAGLAKFHATSKGYSAKEGARISSKLSKWPSQYESMKCKLSNWREIAKTKNSQSDQAYVNSVDDIIIIAEQAIKKLEESKYHELTSMDSKVPVLCHQDFGRGNAILTDKGIIILDLDGVSFDLPARDLRKIIGKMAENRSKWDINNIQDIINWYSCVNPVSEDEKTVLYIDLLFPHWFFGLVKNQFDNNKAIKSSEIDRIAKLEMSKLPIIKKLLVR